MGRKRATPKYQEQEIEQPEVFIKFKTVKLTPKQKQLVDLINKNKIVVVTGPAGTAKTFCAAYAALKLFEKEDDVYRVIITKPTEIVGDTALGFTPGTLEEKLAIYTENFNDVFEDILEPGILQGMIVGKEIQYKAPQFVRGRTMKNAVVIVDEFQSFDIQQLRALVTRMGRSNCKFIFCGDIKQNDIARKYVAVNLFKEVMSGLPNVALFEFDKSDNMRDELVSMIEERFEKLEAEGRLTPNKKNT